MLIIFASLDALAMFMYQTAREQSWMIKALIVCCWGRSEESKAYKLYDPVSNKVVVSRGVVFEENEGWNWGISIKEAKIDFLKWEKINIDESGE